MPSMDHDDLNDLFSDVYKRHVTMVETPTGQEVVFYIGHKNGSEYRVEIKFSGKLFVHKRVDGEWETIHEA